jgi:hypothetical protein
MRRAIANYLRAIAERISPQKMYVFVTCGLYSSGDVESRRYLHRKDAEAAMKDMGVFVRQWEDVKFFIREVSP